jgi:CCR4-NOT transcription complex subunit 7/8
MYAPDSIELLKGSGIDFQRFNTEGIDINTFAELLTTSGLVLFSHVKWVSFHS